MRSTYASKRTGVPQHCLGLVSILIFAAFVFPSITNADRVNKRAVAAARAILTVKDVKFHSASLGRDITYRIYLPHAYAETNRRYPVLYLLHGIWGHFSDWDTESNLATYAGNLDLIIVMADAGNSWYVNSATVPRHKFEDYVAKDLIAYIDANYRTIRERSGRAIAGLSMGGYGALKFGLKYPDMFAFAGSMSGALNAPGDLDTRQVLFRKNLLAVFGPPGSATRKENDVYGLLKQADPAKLSYIYIACGKEDPFVEVNRSFVAQLDAQHVAHEYHESFGSHTWNYWDNAVREMLPVLMRALNPGPH